MSLHTGLENHTDFCTKVLGYFSRVNWPVRKADPPHPPLVSGYEWDEAISLLPILPVVARNEVIFRFYEFGCEEVLEQKTFRYSPCTLAKSVLSS
jgi:hypothetical protein